MIHSSHLVHTGRGGQGAGAPFAVRRARPDDQLLIADLLYHVSEHSRYLRYFQPFPLSLARALAEARRMVRQPEGRALALVATVQSALFPEVVGVAELALQPGAAAAELAVLVRDDYQGRGVGTALGRQLVELARARGVAELHATLLPENRAMLRLLPRLDVPYSTDFDDGLLLAVLRLAPAPREGGGAAHHLPAA